jgi:hypothetical protein
LLLATLFIVILVGYTFVYRPWFLYWGATEEEIQEVYPGDRFIASPKGQTVRAITIRAPIGDVWPWLVQMGQGRGGYYSYDWLENLFGLGIYSTHRIVPRWQNPEVGDIIRMSEEGGMMVAILESEEAMVLYGNAATLESRSTEPDGMLGDGVMDFASTWGFYLKALGKNETRLIVRSWSDWNPGIVGFLAYRVLMEPVHFLMERKMILGIRDRVEDVAEARARREAGQLLNNFLPAYEFDEIYTIVIAATPERVFDMMRAISLGELSTSARVLLSIREFLAGITGEGRGFTHGPSLWNQMLAGDFVLLDETGNTEVVVGWVGRPWRLWGDGDAAISTPGDFIDFNEPGYAKVAANLAVRRIAPGLLEVSTETRIHATDAEARDRFATYWWFIQRGSGLIRTNWLEAIKRRAEAE